MCIMCIIHDNGKKALHSKREAKILEATRKMNEEIAIGLLGPENSRELKTGYAAILREIANMIDNAVKDEDAINEATRNHLAPLESAVKRSLEKEEGEFYTKFGVTMPDEVRAVVTSRAFDEALSASSRTGTCPSYHPTVNAQCRRQPNHDGSHTGKCGDETLVWN